MAHELSGPADEGALVEALRRVAGKQAAFSLIVSDGVSERIYYFAIGGIRVIRSGPRRSASIGEMLIDLGKLKVEQLDEVLAACRQRGKRFGEIAIDLGFVTSGDVEQSMHDKVEEEILDLFIWEGAEYRLIEGQPPKEFYAGRFHSASLTCSVPSFLHNVLAKLEDWRGIVGRLPTGREVYEMAETADPDRCPPARARLLKLFDGTRIAADSIAKSGMRRVPAYEFLLCCLRDGRVRRVSGHSAQKVNRDQIFKEISALEDALKVAVDARIVRQRLARACETAGEKARAAGHWKYLGDFHRKRNELPEALDHYRACVRLLPTDFATRELILEIHRHHRDYGQLVSDGRPLADLFIKHNLLNRAKLLLLQLVGIVPKDASLRRQLVMVLIGLGEQKLALHHLRELAELLESRNAADSELRDVYLRILALDKRDRHARDRLEELTGVKAQRRVFRATAAATVLGLAAVAGVFAYEGAARKHVNIAFADAEVLLEANDFTGARAVLETAAAEYRFARASGAALELAEEILALQRREEERQVQQARSEGRFLSPEEMAEQSRRSQIREAEAFALGERAAQLARSGRLEDAHATLKELLHLYAGTPAAQSARLPISLNVLPREARVIVDGEDLGQGSMVLTYPASAKTTLRVECEGFEPRDEVIDGLWDLELDVSLSKPVLWTYQSDAAFDAAPLVLSDRVVIAGRDRAVTALSRTEGSVLWRTKLGLYDDAAVSPILTPDGIVVATASGATICLDADTGSVRWRHETGVGTSAQPLVADGIVVITSDDGSVAGRAASSGDALWNMPAGTMAMPTQPWRVSAESFAYVGTDHGLTFAGSRDGTVRPRPTSGVELLTSPVADPDADPNRLWAVAADGSLRVFSAGSGRAVKRFPVPSAMAVAPCVAGDSAYQPCTDGSIVAFRANGASLFRARLPERAAATPAFASGQVFIPGAETSVFVIDAETGDLDWRFVVGAPVLATPVIDGGEIFIATADGRLVALRR